MRPSVERMKPTLLIALVLVVLAACAARTTAASAAATVDPGRIVQLLDRLEGIVKADQGNCSKLASDMKAFIAAHNGDFTAFHRESARWSAAQKLVYAKRWGGQLEAAIRSIATGIVTCATNAQVRAALASLSSVKPH